MSSLAHPTQPTKRWHIFCSVIDNYGDIGFCWRLARELQATHQRHVTLWVDNLYTFSAIEPRLNPNLSRQTLEGVAIIRWDKLINEEEPWEIGQVVIEAFGCQLPETYLSAMRQSPPVWINLEYLSAEEWIESCHQAPSPVQGLTRYFFFPGFTTKTGGLLWSKQPDPAQTLSAQSSQERQRALRSLLTRNVYTDPEFTLSTSAKTISLFGYDNANLGSLLEQLRDYPQAVTLLIPKGLVSTRVSAWLGQVMEVGKHYKTGSLTLIPLPFLPQHEYDLLLASCDLNFVRGEDSFVRSQLLGRPCIWQVYPQEEDTHLQKMEDFLARYTQGWPTELTATVIDFYRSWNQSNADESSPLPPTDDQNNTLSSSFYSSYMQQGLPLSAPLDGKKLVDSITEWEGHAKAWQQQLKKLGDLTSNLVTFVNFQV